MQFANPNLLWLLLALPVLVLFFWWAARQRRRLLTQFIQTRLLSVLTLGVSPARRQIRLGCLVSALALLIIALARPQYGFDLQKVERRGLDIVVAIDTSKSMLAEDIAPDRLERAKLAALDLMQRAKSDRLALAAFAGDAFLECPLTFDNSAFQQSVQALNVNTLPLGGTSLAAAIKTAETAFMHSDHHKVLVLLTDGGDNTGGALAAAKTAAKAGVRIFTIGVGTVQGDLLRITDANGNSHYIHDAHGDVVKSRLDETLLRQIAEATGGFYLPLRGANTVEVLYKKGLAPLPKSESEERLVRRYHEQYQWPLTAAILLLLAELFFPERKRRGENNEANLPIGQDARRRTPAGGTIAVLVGILLLPVAAKASPSSALRDYHSGNYTNALQEFSRLAETRTNDLRLIFNAGDAAYRATNYDEAANDFAAAALSPDVNLQEKALYNLGNAQFQQAKSAKDLAALQAGLETAEKSYQHALTLDTNDSDAAYNLGFVSNAVEQIKEFRAEIERAKGEADAAVRQAEFHKALEIMLPLQKTIAAKQFADFTKRLENIDAITTPHQP